MMLVFSLGFNWIIDFLISQSDAALHKFWISENKQLFFFIKNQYFIFSYLLKTIL